MSTLESKIQARDPRDPREQQAAVGRFFYTSEARNHSLFTEIYEYTSHYFKHYKLKIEQPPFVLIQLSDQGGLLKLVEQGDSGRALTLQYDHGGLNSPTTPLWELTSATRGAERTVYKLYMSGGLYVEERTYGRQGELRSIQMCEDPSQVWAAVSLILEDESTHNFVVTKLNKKHFVSSDSILTGLHFPHKKLTASSEAIERFMCDSDYTPEQADEILKVLFGGVEAAANESKYREGMFHIVQTRRYATPEAAFYTYVETLSEIAARRFDSP